MTVIDELFFMLEELDKTKVTIRNYTRRIILEIENTKIYDSELSRLKEILRRYGFELDRIELCSGEEEEKRLKVIFEMPKEKLIIPFASKFKWAEEHPSNLRYAKACLHCMHSWLDTKSGQLRCRKYHGEYYPVENYLICDDFEWDEHLLKMCYLEVENEDDSTESDK